MSYDSALTVFSPDGHLHQVEYAAEAVNKGACVVGVKADNCVVIGAERKAAAKLQDTRTAKKVSSLDERLVLGFAGLQADARVLIDAARLECQNYLLNLQVLPSADYIARYVASVQQRSTIKGGRRPYGVSTLIAGVTNGIPALMQTEPHGILTSWKAQAIGRNSKTVQEYLEKHIEEEQISEKEAIQLVIKALLEVIESGQNGVNLTLVVARESEIEFIEDSKLSQLVQSIEQETIADQESKS